MNGLRFVNLCLLSCFFLYVSAGCGNLGRKKNLEEVLSADPAFKETLELKEQLDNNIGELKDALTKEKRKRDKSIAKLKKDYAKDKKTANARIKKLKADFAPVVNALEFNKKEIEGQIESRRTSVKNLSGMLKELKSLAEKVSDEQSDYAQRIIEVENKIAVTEQEISSLQYDLRIVNLKKSFLK